MGICKAPGVLFVALGAELTGWHLGQVCIVRAVGTVAGGTILCGGRVQCTGLPEAGDLFMTAETKARLSFGQVTGMR